MQFVASRRLLVLYGSETGTAQDVAERVAREARRRHFTVSVASMSTASVSTLTGDKDGHFSTSQLLEIKTEICDNLELDYDADVLSRLPPLAVVFIAATTGQGEDPENMKGFFSNLWSFRQNRKLLSGMNYGVLALGDSSYQKFNYSGKRLNNLLTFLGGLSVLNIGLADDQHDLGPDYVVDIWVEEFWSKMNDLYPLPSDVQPISANVLAPPRYTVTFLDSAGDNNDDARQPESLNLASEIYLPTDLQKPTSTSELGTDRSNPCSSSITKLERVTSEDHFQDVRLVEFDVRCISEPHKPGDVLMIQPLNLDSHVKEFLAVMNIDGDRIVRVETADPLANTQGIPSTVITQPCTIAECVKKYFDIMSIPKRYFFELLSFFTTDEDEKEKFQEFSSAKGQQDLYDYCNRPKRSILEVLADFPYTRGNIPFHYLFELIPMIKPRAYSIASSAAMSPGKAQILVAVVNYKTILKRRRLGVCSNWLTTLTLGHTVNVWIKKGTLKFPTLELPTSISDGNGPAIVGTTKKHPPVIMIGPGTGCAPFRAYIQERIALRTYDEPLILFFGCRNQKSDYFFNEEWTEQASRKQLELYTAFSRDQEDKLYVQHRIREHADRLWELIGNQEAQVFFAGNAKRVPIDIYEALTYVCQRGMAGSEQLASQYMKKTFDKRYQTETWA